MQPHQGLVQMRSLHSEGYLLCIYLCAKHLLACCDGWPQVEEMEEVAVRVSKAVTKLGRDIKAWPVWGWLKETIDAFKRTMPLITDLRNPAMRQRHWDQLMVSGCWGCSDSPACMHLVLRAKPTGLCAFSTPRLTPANANAHVPDLPHRSTWARASIPPRPPSRWTAWWACGWTRTWSSLRS